MKKILFFFILLGLTFFQASKAGIALYTSEIPVTSQSDAERQRATPQGLAEVLTKVTGDSHILDNEYVKDKLSQAEKLLEEFSYLPSTDAKTPYLIHLSFSPGSVNYLLRKVRAPIWGQNRPLILIWGEYEAPYRTAEIIDSGSKNKVQTLLQAEADKRGLPILFPMMDMIDLNQVKVNDIVTMKLDVLSEAAKRYGSDAILITRIFENPHGFSIQAKLIMDKTQWNWKLENKTLEGVTDKLIDLTTDTLSGRYAVVVTDKIQSRITLKVAEVKEQTDLTELIQYIQHLTAVKNIAPIKINGNIVELDLQLQGTKQAFIQSITLGKHLIPVAEDIAANTYTYSWKP